MKILVACEESGVVTKEFLARGHDAWSCDILETSGDRTDRHLKCDVRSVLCESTGWDMIIAFPPCTHLASSGARWFEEKRRDGRQQQGIDFFMEFVRAMEWCTRVAIENPVGIMSSHYRVPNQIIQPWQFGDSYEKRTCLWLHGLPNLVVRDKEAAEVPERIRYASGRSMPEWYANAWKLAPEERARVRSKTFPGIAKAMAKQWG